MQTLSPTLTKHLSPEELRKALSEHPFVEGMDPQHVQMMVDIVDQVHFDAEHYIFHQGEPATHLYLVIHGCIALEVFNEDYGPILLQTVESGEELGWSWFLAPYQWRFDAKTVAETTALVFDAGKLLEYCESDHDFGYDLMRRMASIVEQRLNAAREHLQDTYARPRY